MADVTGCEKATKSASAKAIHHATTRRRGQKWKLTAIATTIAPVSAK